MCYFLATILLLSRYYLVTLLLHTVLFLMFLTV